MKGVIKEDHIPINKYEIIVAGMPPLLFTEILGLEKELQTTDLPDRTTASGGNTGPVEFTAKQPMHHTVEVAAMELWLQEGQDPVTPTYKKAGTLIRKSLTGNVVNTTTIIGLYVSKKKEPDLEMANEGEMAAIEWTFKADDSLPV